MENKYQTTACDICNEVFPLSLAYPMFRLGFYKICPNCLHRGFRRLPPKIQQEIVESCENVESTK